MTGCAPCSFHQTGPYRTARGTVRSNKQEQGRRSGARRAHRVRPKITTRRARGVICAKSNTLNKVSQNTETIRTKCVHSNKCEISKASAKIQSFVKFINLNRTSRESLKHAQGARARASTHTHTHTHRHARSLSHTHTHTHTHTQRIQFKTRRPVRHRSNS